MKRTSPSRHPVTSTLLPLLLALFGLLASPARAELGSLDQIDLGSLKALSEKGDPAAQTLLGGYYYLGQNVPQSDMEATRWFRRAAEQGYPAAQNNLGVCYDTGRGVSRNPAEAARWYRRAAEQGYAQAQYSLGTCYSEGSGVPQSPAEALRWFLMACNQGHSLSQLLIAESYANGSGVPQDLAQAHKWYNLVQAYSDDEETRSRAAQARDALARRMNPEQIRDAQREAVEWKIAPASPKG